MGNHANKRDFSVGAVIVTFNADLRVLSGVLNTVIPQVSECLIVDNTSDATSSNRIEGLAREHGSRFNWMETNRGVATAHNHGILWARGQGFTHVLLLDQDSIPADDMVEKLLIGYERLLDKGAPIAAVGPRYINPLSSQSSSFLRFGRLRCRQVHCADKADNSLVPAGVLISSGSLIPLVNTKAIGLMDDSLFIDHVDTDWYLKARAKGFLAYGVCNALMYHALGVDTVKIWFGRWRFISYHLPLRYYYMYRNSVLLYRRRYAPLKWIIFDLRRLILRLLIFGIAISPRQARLTMMLRGLWHGLRNYRGQYQYTAAGSLEEHSRCQRRTGTAD